MQYEKSGSGHGSKSNFKLPEMWLIVFRDKKAESFTQQSGLSNMFCSMIAVFDFNAKPPLTQHL